MTTHRAPFRGDKWTAVAPCCRRRVIELPDDEPLVPDWETPTCGLPVTVEEPRDRAA